MIRFYLFAILCAVGSVTLAGKKQPRTDDEFKTCKLTQWKKVGCFKDFRNNRALPDQLVNIRDKNSNAYKQYDPRPKLLDWYRISDSIQSLACHCAEKTLEKGYKVFGLQFYGECWSGENGLETYNKFGKVKDDTKCVMDLDLEDNEPWRYCDIASDQACVGRAKTNYVYILQEKPEAPTDGGWSEWGDWAECDKTCGTGKQVRERTCTNPPPDPQGKDCEGPGEETQSCNLIECPIDGGFTPWTPNSECTKTCGGGTQKFGRTCTNPPPQHGGQDCDGPKEKDEPCNDFTCPIPCTRAIDLGVILDATNSVGMKNFQISKEFVLTLVNSMMIAPNASHLGIIVYNIKARIVLSFNELAKQNFNAIKVILGKENKLKGKTYTDRALEMAGNELFTTYKGDRPDKHDILLVLTDGKTNNASEPYPDVLKPLEDKGVKVIAVGIGNNILVDELIKIAMGKMENVIQVLDYDKLYDKLQVIIDSSCQDKGASEMSLK